MYVCMYVYVNIHTYIQTFIATTVLEQVPSIVLWPSFAMPPFDDEPAEESAKPLNFLSFRHATGTRQSKPAVQLFGPEGAESAGDGGVVKSRPKRPFEDEGDETNGEPGPSKACSTNKSAAHSIFGDEGSEDEQPNLLPTKKPVLFGDESDESEADQSFSSNDETAFQLRKDTVFSFGWVSVSTFKKATFWRENMNDATAKKPKRQYDNSKRSGKAAYKRQKTHGFYKRNGVDPDRLRKLFDSPSCSCAFVRNLSIHCVSPDKC